MRSGGNAPQMHPLSLVQRSARGIQHPSRAGAEHWWRGRRFIVTLIVLALILFPLLDKEFSR